MRASSSRSRRFSTRRSAAGTPQPRTRAPRAESSRAMLARSSLALASRAKRALRPQTKVFLQNIENCSSRSRVHRALVWSSHCPRLGGSRMVIMRAARVARSALPDPRGVGVCPNSSGTRAQSDGDRSPRLRPRGVADGARCARTQTFPMMPLDASASSSCRRIEGSRARERNVWFVCTPSGRRERDGSRQPKRSDASRRRRSGLQVERPGEFRVRN